MVEQEVVGEVPEEAEVEQEVVEEVPEEVEVEQEVVEEVLEEVEVEQEVVEEVPEEVEVETGGSGGSTGGSGGGTGGSGGSTGGSGGGTGGSGGSTGGSGGGTGVTEGGNGGSGGSSGENGGSSGSSGEGNNGSGENGGISGGHSGESESEESGSKESGSKESGSKESGSKESGSKESGSKESGSKESGSKESGSKESGSKESESKESGSKESGSKESGSKESGSKESGSKESGSKEKSGRASRRVENYDVGGEDSREETDPCEIECGLGHYFRHPTDCTKFIQCSPYGPQELPCGTGTRWDQNFLQCMPDDSTPCIVGNGPCTSQSSGSSLTGGSCDLVCPQTNGLFAHPLDCTKWVHCSNGIPYEKDCPSNLFFDPILKVCNWQKDTVCFAEENTGCEIPIVPPVATSEPVIPPAVCDCECCLRPHPEDCQSYYYCDVS